MNNIVYNSISIDHFMGEAINEAKKSLNSGDIPVGCIIVYDNKIISKAHNQIELLKDATAHAEMIAITQAESYLGDWRLNEVALFVTKEPCPMCAGAIIQSRLKKVVFGAFAPNDGAAGTVINLLQNNALGTAVECVGGVREDECRTLLREFFKIRRLRKKSSP